MTKTPHAIFTRVIHGVAFTIEINPLTHRSVGYSTTNGVTTPVHYATVLEFRKGMTPFWGYQAGLDAPLWNDSFSSAYSTDPASVSYITLLRMAVAQLTGGGMGYISGRKPKLGFHSKYKAMKRAERDAERALKAAV